MKKLSFLFAALGLMTLSFTDPVKEVVTMSVDTENSYIAWNAAKVTGKHNGKVMLKGGALNFEDGMLKGGEFEIDMTTITVEDLEGNMRTKLEGHLKSADFFNVEAHNTATFKTTKVLPNGNAGEYKIIGDLTIKGITNEIKYYATVTEGDSNTMGSAEITIDRTEYDIRYGSNTFFGNLGNKTIYDDFNLQVNLVAKK